MIEQEDDCPPDSFEETKDSVPCRKICSSFARTSFYLGYELEQRRILTLARSQLSECG